MSAQDNDCLNLFEQQPALQIYTQICSIFPVPDSSKHFEIIQTLEKGLERLSKSFPWIAGQVINEGRSEGNSGIFKIVPLDKTPRLVVKDLRDDPSVPSLEGMKKANFPMTMLDESLICPRKTIPTAEEAASGFPVFLLQATFIKGGFILAFLGQHQTMDGTGQGRIISFLSRACRGDSFTSSEIESGNLPRRNIIPLLGVDEKPTKDLEYQIMAPTPTGGQEALQLTLTTQCTWAYFTFIPDKVTALKKLATETVPSGYISTDDAITAYIWKSVSRARLHRLDASTESVFARAVNVRQALGISPGYLGLIQNMTYNISTLGDLASKPLGITASQLRSRLDPEILAHGTRSLATVLDRSPDKGAVKFTAGVDKSSGIMLSSWVQQDTCELDFGLGLGKPEVVRRPRFDLFERLMYLMPRARDGEIAAAICLRDEDMEALRGDEEFGRFAAYIG